MRCRACLSDDCRVFLYLGPMPLINKFLSKSDEPETYYPLNVMKCNKCHLVQLDYTVDPEIMFKDYTYTPSSSTTMKAHFKELAQKVLARGKKDPFVVEIASNDGTMLVNFKDAGVRFLGVEPATNIARMANEKGLTTLNKFFNRETAKEVVLKHGKADLILGTNVLAHVPEIRDFAQAVKELMSEDGFAIFESPYLLDFLDGGEFDTVYHEHTFYLSIHPLKRLFEEFGMKIFDVVKSEVHGGSVQIFIEHNNGKRKVEDSVGKVLNEEIKEGLTQTARFEKFADKVREQRLSLLSQLSKIKKDGKKIAAYGAAAKGNVLLNYCGIGPDVIDYIVDKSPLKQNKFTPGKRLPVYSPEMLKKETPDYLLILPWNIADEIMKQEDWFSKSGGRFIVPFRR